MERASKARRFCGLLSAVAWVAHPRPVLVEGLIAAAPADQLDGAGAKRVHQHGGVGGVFECVRAAVGIECAVLEAGGVALPRAFEQQEVILPGGGH